jgi:superfamily II DNA or RNA helicase
MKKIFSLIVANILKYVPIKEFRSGQQTVYEAICSSILAGHRTMFIEGPTGMGKSFIQSMIADSVINGSQTIKVLLLVPKITLLDQMVGEFKSFVSHLTFGIVGDGTRDFNGQVTIMTYQSFMRIKDDELKQYSVILLDEAHKALGEETSQKIERQEHAIIIGFTATATYDEKKNLKNFLKHEAYRISIREAVKTGMLSAIQFILGRVTIEISGRKKEKRRVSTRSVLVKILFAKAEILQRFDCTSVCSRIVVHDSLCLLPRYIKVMIWLRSYVKEVFRQTLFTVACSQMNEENFLSLLDGESLRCWLVLIPSRKALMILVFTE